VDWLGSVDSLQEAEFSIWFLWLFLSLCLLSYLLYRYRATLKRPLFVNVYPDSWFFSSRIQQLHKRGRKKRFSCLSTFIAKNFRKLKIINFFRRAEKDFILVNWQRMQVFLAQKLLLSSLIGSGIRIRDQKSTGSRIQIRNTDVFPQTIFLCDVRHSIIIHYRRHKIQRHSIIFLLHIYIHYISLLAPP